MSHPWRLHRYTYADYVALETYSSDKHEFFDGEIYARAQGGAEQSGLSVAIIAILYRVDGPCIVYDPGLRFYVEAVGLATYPDCSVIWPVRRYEPGPETTALNPTILVEVTSDASEEYDLGFKREAYHTIPSLREYTIVSHRERRITIDVRNEDGTWTTRTASRGERFELPSLQTSIEVDDVYRQSTIP
jgi:Uma2 family endonuclease